MKEELIILQNTAIPDSFLKRVFSETATYLQIEKELLDYAERHEYDFNELLYTAVKKSLKNGIFFSLEEKTRDELFFNACGWAAEMESIKKNVPSTIKEFKENRKLLLVQISVSLIDSIYLSYNTEINRNITLSKYMSIFIEMNQKKKKKEKN